MGGGGGGEGGWEDEEAGEENRRGGVGRGQRIGGEEVARLVTKPLGVFFLIIDEGEGEV